MSKIAKLDAYDLFGLVPGLHYVDGYFAGLTADANDCWEGHAAVTLHRENILREIAGCVGPNARPETVNPLTRTQAAYDTMVEHFFAEYPPDDPEQDVYMEARKTPEGLQHFFEVTLPAWRSWS